MRLQRTFIRRREFLLSFTTPLILIRISVIYLKYQTSWFRWWIKLEVDRIKFFKKILMVFLLLVWNILLSDYRKDQDNVLWLLANMERISPILLVLLLLKRLRICNEIKFIIWKIWFSSVLKITRLKTRSSQPTSYFTEWVYQRPKLKSLSKMRYFQSKKSSMKNSLRRDLILFSS